MINIEKKENCCGCFGCYNICPVNAITMEEDDKGFKYPVVNKEKCINCNLCENVCPILNREKTNKRPKAFAAYSIEDEVRLESSSGGIFSLLAETILDNNGAVFGACFDNEFMVKHIMINNKSDLKKLRNSKYVQSSINKTYMKCKKILEKDKLVLFTGTPCQIDGLLKYLGKKYDNLFTQDIICHGVPSQKVWKKYLDYRKKKDLNIPKEINFREKKYGWNLFSIMFKYNKKLYRKNHKEDLYMRCFLQNICLRDSCYSCKFKGINRNSDITLADFWGIKNIEPKLYDNKGVSLVFINSAKGDRLFEKIKDRIIFKEIDLEVSINSNKAAIQSVPMNNNREAFFENINKYDFDVLSKRYLRKEKATEKVKTRVKKMIYKFEKNKNKK